MHLAACSDKAVMTINEIVACRQLPGKSRSYPMRLLSTATPLACCT